MQQKQSAKRESNVRLMVLFLVLMGQLAAADSGPISQPIVYTGDAYMEGRLHGLGLVEEDFRFRLAYQHTVGAQVDLLKANKVVETLRYSTRLGTCEWLQAGKSVLAGNCDSGFMFRLADAKSHVMLLVDLVFADKAAFWLNTDHADWPATSYDLESVHRVVPVQEVAVYSLSNTQEKYGETLYGAVSYKKVRPKTMWVTADHLVVDAMLTDEAGRTYVLGTTLFQRHMPAAYERLALPVVTSRNNVLVEGSQEWRQQ